MGENRGVIMIGPTFQEKFEAKMTCNIAPLAVAGIGLGALALGRGIQGYFGTKGAKEAAEIQARSATEAMGTLERFYGQAGEQLAPYQAAGTQGLEALTQGVLGGEFQTDVPEFQYDPFEFDFEADPGYQFRLQQGEQAIERSAAARGGALGGGTLKGLQEYGQGLASQEYGQAYQRARGEYTGERAFDYGLLSDLYGRQVQQQGIKYGGLAGLTGIGQQAATQQAGLTTGLGSNLANLITGRGAVQAAGAAGSAQAIGGTAGGIGTDLGSLLMLYGMGGGGGGGAAGGTGAAGGFAPLPQPPPLYPSTGLYGY